MSSADYLNAFAQMIFSKNYFRYNSIVKMSTKA